MMIGKIRVGYDLVLNSSRFSPELAAPLIAETVRCQEFRTDRQVDQSLSRPYNDGARASRVDHIIKDS